MTGNGLAGSIRVTSWPVLKASAVRSSASFRSAKTPLGSQRYEMLNG